MSRDGSVELDFAGESRRFRLGLGELEAIQETCDAGPGEILQRLGPWMLVAEARRRALAAGRAPDGLVPIAAGGGLGPWRVQDIRQPLLWGLIGGGLEANAAGQLIETFVIKRGAWLEAIPPAFLVVMAAVAGPDDEAAAGEAKGEGDLSPPSPGESSASA